MLCCAVCFAVVIVAVLYRAVDSLNVVAAATGFVLVIHFSLPFVWLFRDNSLTTILLAEQVFIIHKEVFMSLFVLSDLHLSTNESTNKSMEVFGNRWQDYMQKIKKNWDSVVTDTDTVIIPGDISWGMNLNEALGDLKYIDSLNGKKLLGKGNHDFWWTTNKKMKEFFEIHNLNSLSILHNNAYIIEDRIICGTRGWFPDESKQTPANNTDYDKILNRESIRLKMSLCEAKKLQDGIFEERGVKLPILVFLHFPPIWGEYVMQPLVNILKEFEISHCYYGHIHNSYSIPATFEYENIKFTLTSCDFLSFYPLKI